jgi:hypothetical protein
VQLNLHCEVGHRKARMSYMARSSSGGIQVDKGLIESEVMAQKESRKCRGEHQIAKLSDKSAAGGGGGGDEASGNAVVICNLRGCDCNNPIKDMAKRQAGELGRDCI